MGISQNPAVSPLSGLSFGPVYNGAVCGVRLIFDEVEFDLYLDTENHRVSVYPASSLFYFGTGYFQPLGIGFDLTVTPTDGDPMGAGTLDAILETESPEEDILKMTDVLNVDGVTPAQLLSASGLSDLYSTPRIGGTGQPCPCILRFDGDNGVSDDTISSAATTWSVSGTLNIFWIPLLTGV